MSNVKKKEGEEWLVGGRIHALSLLNRLEYSPGLKLPGICEGESGHVILSSFTTLWHTARRASRSLIVIGESPDSSNPEEKRESWAASQDFTPAKPPNAAL